MIAPSLACCLSNNEVKNSSLPLFMLMDQSVLLMNVDPEVLPHYLGTILLIHRPIYHASHERQTVKAHVVMSTSASQVMRPKILNTAMAILSY